MTDQHKPLSEAELKEAEEQAETLEDIYEGRAAETIRRLIADVKQYQLFMSAHFPYDTRKYCLSGKVGNCGLCVNCDAALLMGDSGHELDAY